MRFLVCGGRDLKDEELVFKGLDRVRYERTIFDPEGTSDVIISGAAKGADSIAADYANTWGLILKEYPAEWAKHGRKAGYIRNRQMLDDGRPDIVVAFPGGKGTQMMVNLALKAGVTVIQVGRDPLGNIVMGAKGSSSSLNEPGIKTKMFQQRYIERVTAMKLLTPGQRDGIYREVVQEELMYFSKQDAAAKAYEEILKSQEVLDKLTHGNEP